MAIDRSRQTKWDAENLARFSVGIPKGAKLELDEYAKNMGIPMNRLIILALEAYTGLTISRKGRKPEPTDE